MFTQLSFINPELRKQTRSSKFLPMNQQEMLRKYYTEIFPADELFGILEVSATREMAFTTQQDGYIRYLAFASRAAFAEKIAQVVPKNIHIGAIHDAPPGKLSGAKPIARELVFDIDLTDYPRACCEGKQICRLCFAKIQCAVKLLDYSLREEFGFREIGFVFSGRRGVHCWVFDGKLLEQSVRADICKFFQAIVDRNQHVPAYEQIMREFAPDEKELIQQWFVRIDKQVTVGMGHLIKMPFAVHADSLNIAVPIDPQNLLEYDDIIALEQVVQDPSKLEPYVKILKQWR
ncbi:DNA primase small subunit [Pancytospora philotis]|nr:DNA primase small subunit [Pancytospora philotis]